MTGSSKPWQRWSMWGGGLIITASFSALALVGCPGGGVGDPCVPEEEYLENFAGFKLTEENIESRSFQCQTRICLVNHFQGRVSCPFGQGPPVGCDINMPVCDTASGETCKEAGVLISDCDPTECTESGADPNNCNNGAMGNPACGGRRCDQDGRYCHCSAGDCPVGYTCDVTNDRNLCATHVCSVDASPNNGRCYVPGTNDPVAVPVCSQCAATGAAAETLRHAENTVYCSCRCDVADGEEKDENFNFCKCGEGYVCQEIRKNVGLGDKQITGKYCVKQGSEYPGEAKAALACGQVQGYWGPQCAGLGN